MATGIPHWDEDPEAWDLLFIAGQPMTGAWTVEDGNVKRVIDVKKGPGRDGAIIKDMGYEPGAFTLAGQFCSKEDWDTFQSIIDTLHAAQKLKEREPVLVHHPMLMLLGVTKVYITEIEIPRLDNGVMSARIRVFEWTKPRRVGKAKPKGLPPGALNSELSAATPIYSTMTDEEVAVQQKAQQENFEAQQSFSVPQYSSNIPPGSGF